MATFLSCSPLAVAGQPADFGTPPSGAVPILFDDHHVYTKPTQVRRGRVLAAMAEDGKLLVPLKAMFEQMGGTVEYDPLTHSTQVRTGQAFVEVTVGVKQVRINGEVRPLDVPPIMYHDDILVPIRVIAEALGAYVEYEPNLRAVVVRFNAAPAATPPPAPATTSAPVSVRTPQPAVTPRPTVPPGAPIPVEPPQPETFLAADVAISPNTANAYAPNVHGSTGQSFDVRAASEFSVLDLPLVLDGEYAQYAYTHPAGDVTTIGGFGSADVPAFDAHDTELTFSLGAQINPEKFYIDASYATLGDSYGYPGAGGLGVGFEKLPVLERRFSYDMSFFYYPNISGACNTASCPRNIDEISYELMRYAAGVTYDLGPIFLEAGYRGDSGRRKTYVPVGFTHDGIYVGIGGNLR